MEQSLHFSKIQFHSACLDTYHRNLTLTLILEYHPNVEIQKAEGFDRWRVIAPYDESIKNDDGGNGDWLAGEAAPYIEFWLTDKGYVDYNEFFTGLNYQADGNSPIYVYSPSAFGIDPKLNKFLDEKTVQLAPYFYVSSLGGGWDYTGSDGIIIITLP